MTRGKHAAQAARQRAEAASDALCELKRKYDAERAGWSKERADLLSEVQRLSNRLVSEVAELAQVEVSVAQEDAAEKVRQAREDYEERAIKVLTLIYNHPEVGKHVPPLVFDGFAQILGVNGKAALVEAMERRGRPESNRAKRRAVVSVSKRRISTMAAEAETDADLALASQAFVESTFANRSRYVDPA